MVCPACQADMVSQTAACPHCGAGIVESTAERGPISAELPLPPEAARETLGSSDGSPGAGDTRLVVARSSLPAVLWRQPAVRAVAQAGAGAVALTLGVRLLRAWLARPQAVRAVTSSALPVVADLLHSMDAPSGQSWRQERGLEVSETFVYMRRVTRRR